MSVAVIALLQLSLPERGGAYAEAQQWPAIRLILAAQISAGRPSP